mmetsp:Transcript_19595/g.75224  ORF Transcript_19595/g.75224 Transcript_19595/m.75224 type:complete len:200 (-) Transcript_19595:43-642(-)
MPFVAIDNSVTNVTINKTDISAEIVGLLKKIDVSINAGRPATPTTPASTQRILDQVLLDLRTAFRRPITKMPFPVCFPRMPDATETTDTGEQLMHTKAAISNYASYAYLLLTNAETIDKPGIANVVACELIANYAVGWPMSEDTVDRWIDNEEKDALLVSDAVLQFLAKYEMTDARLVPLIEVCRSVVAGCGTFVLGKS